MHLNGEIVKKLFEWENLKEMGRWTESNIHFRPVITRWSGSTSSMRAISESRYANLLSRTRLVAVSVVFGGWGKAPIWRVCLLA